MNPIAATDILGMRPYLGDRMKVLCIVVPQLRRDFYENVGVRRLMPTSEAEYGRAIGDST